MSFPDTGFLYQKNKSRPDDQDIQIIINYLNEVI